MMRKKIVVLLTVVVLILSLTIGSLSSGVITNIKAKFDSSSKITVLGNSVNGTISYNGKNYVPESVLNALAGDYYAFSKTGNKYVFETAAQQKSRIEGNAVSLMNKDLYSFPRYKCSSSVLKLTEKQFGGSEDISITNGSKEFNYESGIKLINYISTGDKIARTYVGNIASSLVFTLAAKEDVSFTIKNGWTNLDIEKISMKASESGKVFTVPLSGVEVFVITNMRCSSEFTIGNPKLVLAPGKTKEDVKNIEVDMSKFGVSDWGLNIIKLTDGMNGLAPYGIYQRELFLNTSYDTESMYHTNGAEKEIETLESLDQAYGFNTLSFSIVPSVDSDVLVTNADRFEIGKGKCKANEVNNFIFSTKGSDFSLPAEPRIFCLYQTENKYLYNASYYLYNIKATRK